MRNICNTAFDLLYIKSFIKGNIIFAYYLIISSHTSHIYGCAEKLS